MNAMKVSLAPTRSYWSFFLLTNLCDEREVDVEDRSARGAGVFRLMIMCSAIFFRITDRG